MGILLEETTTVEVDPNLEVVTVADCNVTVDSSADVTTTTACTVTPENSDTTVDVVKNEYSIVGDGLYASINAEAAPQWLVDIIDSVVATSVTAGMVDYDLLVQDVRNAIDALDVAANTYVEQITFDAQVNQIISTRLTTLNATLGTTYATIVNLDTAVANSEFALTQSVNDLTAAYTNEITSQITTLQTAYSDADSALALDINALTTAFTDQEGNLTGIANAVQTVQTYVGLDPNGVPNTSGMLLRLDDLEDQTDGIIEYLYYDTYTDIAGATNEATALVSISSAWGNAENNNIVYFKDTTNAYGYQSSSNSWIAVTDTSLYQALQNAAAAQSTADGVIVSYYAWDQTAAPATSVLWFANDNILYRYVTGQWVAITAKEGDTLVAYDNTTKDVTFYEYQSSNWVMVTSNGIVANAKAVTDLDFALETLDNNVFGVSGLEQSLSGAITDEGARVESKFAYNSTIGLNGLFYSSGFGLTATGTGGTGTEGDPFGSEFWINAERFKFTNDAQSGQTTPFTIDASGPTPQVTFNGVVNFTNTNMTAYDNNEIVIGGRNLLKNALSLNLTAVSNGISGIGFIDSLNYSPPSFNGLVLKQNIDYIVSFIQWTDVAHNVIIDLYPDTLPEYTYSITTTPTKYQFIFNSSSANMLSCNLRFFGPNAGQTVYTTDIKLEEGNKATTWTAAPEDVTVDVSGPIASNNDILAQKLGYSNYADLVAKAATGNTVISGGYLNADVIAANTAITSPIIDGGTVTGTTVTGGTIRTSATAATNGIVITGETLTVYSGGNPRVKLGLL